LVGGLFFIFAVCCFLWVPIVYFFFPETNQLQFEDIDHLFEGGDRITRGVFRAKGGRTAEAGWHQRAKGVLAEKGEDGLGEGEGKLVKGVEDV